MRRLKYKNCKTTVDGITFDSAKESRRYTELKLLEKAGEISELTLQPVFELAPSVTLSGRKKPALKYIADFSYKEAGYLVVEDVKSPMTRQLPAYRIKLHLLKHIYGLEVEEI